MLTPATMDLDARQSLMTLDAARAVLVAAARPCHSEPAPVAAAVGRVTSGPLRALADLPADDNSALDGFAVRAAETGAALPIAFAVAAGDDPPPLPAGRCAGIATGGVIPDGADAVIAVEDAVVEGESMRAPAPPDPGAGIRRRGADVRAGELVVGAGVVLTPLAVAALAAAGYAEIPCTARPRAVVFTTGDELVPPGAQLRRGLIHDSNGVLIAGTLAGFGCDVRDGGRVPDTRGETERLFADALGADLVVSSGGVSVGPRDHVKPALRALGVTEILWRVAIQPGKPIWAGRSPAGALVIDRRPHVRAAGRGQRDPSADDRRSPPQGAGESASCAADGRGSRAARRRVPSDRAGGERRRARADRGRQWRAPAGRPGGVRAVQTGVRFAEPGSVIATRSPNTTQRWLAE
jgi:molybdopterin molybdotransferase